MSKQLPLRPNLEHLKKQAKALLKQLKTSQPAATLADSQRALAKNYGFRSWSALKSHVLSQQPDPSEDQALAALLEAAGAGNIELVTQLLDQHPRILDERGGTGTRTALHRAVFGDREAMIHFLLERGADPNIRCDGDSATPLHFAAEREHLGIIRLLVEHGADPIGEGDYHELEVIGWATCFGSARKDVVDYLISHGARHNIFSAVATGETDIIRALAASSPTVLEKRMDLENKRRRPLHLAVVKKQPDALRTLLEVGAHTESLDEASLTALDQAALSGETEMAQLLLEHGAKVRLPAAIALNRTLDIERLLRRDPDSFKPGNRWGTLIVRACEQSPAHVIESLIKAGASVDVRDDPKTAIDSTSGYTPLHAAGFFGNDEAAKVLLQHGANVRVRDEKYRGTPSGWANYAGHHQVRDIILQGPIDIFEAMDRGLNDRVASILEREPEALHQALDGETPVQYATRLGNAEALRLLEVAHSAYTMARSAYRDPTEKP